MRGKPQPESRAALDLSALLRTFAVKDLSHTLQEGMPTFPTHSKYYHLEWEQPNDPATMYQILMHEHNGTHVDAPAHYIAGGPDPDKHYMHHVRADALIGLACAIDLAQDPPDLVEVELIEGWEKRHGPIGDGDIVIFNFGWHLKWKLNDAMQRFLDPWPGLSRGSAEYLLGKGVRAVGTDCLGLDRAESVDIPAHDVLLANGVLIMENLANLGGLPSRFFFFASPLKIYEGSGSPIRALAFVPAGETEAGADD
jgi:arylformamidase